MSMKPIQMFPVESAAAAARREEAASKKEIINILLVDDQPANLLALEALLADTGYALTRAASGPEALRCVLEKEFALILLDVLMPGMDGFETAKLIRERRQSVYTPIIFITATGSNENHVSRGYSLGAVDYIYKPIVAEILTAKVNVFAELYIARKQIEAEQKQLDERLREQQFYTRSLFESNIDAIMTTDPSGIITDVNKQMETLTGCTRDELIGAPFKNYFTDPERAEAVVKLVLSNKKVIDYELTASARDGKKTKTVVSYNATAFYDRNRKLQGVFAAARNVTGHKHVDQAQFLAKMSHELGTPLKSILNLSRILSDNGDENLTAKQIESAKTIYATGNDLLLLIEEWSKKA